MKKGKIINLLAGIFDILFALGMFAVIGLHFLETNFIYSMSGPIYYLLFVVLGFPISYMNSLTFVYLGIIGLIGLFSLIFGSATLVRIGKEREKYYRKGGRLISYAVIETVISLIFMLIHLIPCVLGVITLTNALVALIANLLIFVIILFRYIGIGLFYSGKKKYLAETPVSK